MTERTIAALTMDEVKLPEQAADRPRHRDMALSLRLMLYCGVRPAEVSRIDPQRDIVGNELIIRPQSSKTGGGRVIPLRKVQTFLRRHPQQKIIPRNQEKCLHAMRRATDA